MKQAILKRTVLLLFCLSIGYVGFSQLGTTTAVTNVNCNGGNDGAVDLTVTGGVTPYSYIWSNSATVQDITGLTAGTYTVTVSDSGGPSVGPMSWNYTYNPGNHIILLPVGSITINSSAISVGDFIGAFYTIPTGGVGCGGYQMWGGSQTSLTAYVDDNTTTTKDGFSENEPFGWKVWHVISGSNGVVVNMTGTYSFGSTTYSSGAMSGIATMTGTYITSAIEIDTATVIQPDVIGITGTPTNPACYGGTNGTVNISITGGTSPYTYLWNNGVITQNLTGVGSGTYTVTVTDGHLCTQTSSFVLNNPAQIVVSTFGSNVFCNGGSNGAIYTSILGGLFPYTYHWQNNATTAFITGLTAGSYSLTVTDAANCSSTGGYTVTQPLALSVSNTTGNISCNGFTDGYINTTTTGGTPGYTFHWSNNATIQNISGLTAGTYALTVTDLNNCLYTASYNVTQPGALSLNTVITNVSCFGGSNGSIDLTVNGGISPYVYHWQNNSVSQDINNITAGNTYAVTVTDNNYCVILGGPYSVTQSALLSAGATAVNVNCFGGNNGSVSSTVIGGNAPYLYLWSNNATTQNINGITAGTFTLTVTDSNNCTATASANIIQPAVIGLSVTVTNVSCFSFADGTVDLTVTGGIAPYTYQWNNNAVSQDLTNIPAGNYSVTVTDMNTCTTTISSSVTQPASLSILSLPSLYNSYNISYYGGSDGSIDITVSGGTAPYTYLWSNNAITQDMYGLTAGTYTLTVTDSHLCTSSASNNMTQPLQGSLITVSGVETNVSCYGGSDGTVNITVSGGIPPYTYSWSNSATFQDINSLPSGTYTVTVNDSGSYTPTFEWTYNNYLDNHVITVPSGTVLINSNPITSGDYVGVFFTTTNGLACGGYSLWTGTGNIAVTAMGDDVLTTQKDGFVSNEQFNWKVWSTSDGCAIDMVATYSTLEPNQGNYVPGGLSAIASLTGTGTCPGPGPDTEIFTITVTQPGDLTISGVINNVTCNGGSNGSIMLTVSGGTPPYIYQWNTGASAQNLTGIAAGTYNVTVTDMHLCTANAQFTVNEQASLTLSYILSDYLGFNISVNGGIDGWIDLSVNGGVSPYTYLWSNGALSQDIENLPAGSYSITVTDSYNCTGITSITLTQPAPAIPLDATFIVDDVSCYGLSDGSINLSVTGGETPYYYFWSNNQSTQDISGLEAGSYSITIVDDSGTYGGPFDWTYTQTGVNHTVLVLSNALNLIGYPAQNDDYIGLFYHLPTGGMACAGYITWDNTATAITVWGDDATTVEKEGFADGEVFTWKYKRQLDGYETTLIPTYMPPNPPVITNDSTYTSNGMSGVSYLTAMVPPIILPQILIETVEVNQPPEVVVNASPDVSTCLGSGVTINATGNAVSYVWSNGFNGTSQNVNPTTTTTYTVTGTDANGCSSTDEVVVTVNPLPVVDLGTDQTVVVNNQLTLDAGNFDEYEWSTSESTQTITLPNTTVGSFDYSVTVTDANDCNGSDVVNITVTYEITEIDNTSNISIYPNPGAEYFNLMVEYELPTDFELTILSLDGKVIITRSMKDASVYKEKFNISGFAKGTYLVKATSGKGIKVEKLIIQ